MDKNFQSAVGERIDGLTSWKARLWAPIILGLIMAGDSYDNLVVAYTMPSLREQWGLDPIIIGALISSGYAGQIFGLLLLGPAAEKFGRLAVFNACILAMCILSIGCAFAQSAYLFMVLRFVQGIALGGAIPACTSYVNELAPTASRGRYFSLFQFLMVSGYALSSILAPLVIPNYGWRIMYLIGAAPALLLPLVLFTLPESPRWLARRGRVVATNKALKRFGAPTVDEGLPPGRPSPNTSAIRALFAPNYRKMTIVMSVLWFFISLVGYTYATWTPTFYVQFFNLSIANALRYSAIASGIFVFAPLVFAATIDRLGRRLMTLILFIATGALLIGLMIVDHSQTILVVTLVTSGWVTAAAAYQILVPYTADVFPTEIRAAGTGFSTAFARAASMLTPIVVGGTLAFTGSINGVFGLLAAASFIATVVWALFARETARKSLEELENLER
jgi:putative MFS transporter